MLSLLENAKHWSTRHQILAIVVADFPIKVIQLYFLTKCGGVVNTVCDLVIKPSRVLPFGVYDDLFRSSFNY